MLIESLSLLFGAAAAADVADDAGEPLTPNTVELPSSTASITTVESMLNVQLLLLLLLSRATQQ